jgi:hypothetical protein
LGGSLNEYAVNKSTMKAVGTNVPVDVSGALRLGDLNVQTQLSPHFLVLDSPGSVAKAINAAVHLEDMDACIVEANKRVRTLGQDIERTQMVVVQLEKERDAFVDLDGIEAIIGKAQTYYSQCEQLDRDVRALTAIIDDLIDAEAKIAELPPDEIVAECLKQIDEVQRLEQIVSKIKALGRQCVEAQNTAADANKAVVKAQAVLDAWLDDFVCPTCGRQFDADAKAYVQSA